MQPTRNLTRSAVSSAALTVISPSNNPDPVARFLENSSRELDASIQGRIKTESLLYEGLVTKRDDLDLLLRSRHQKARKALDPLEAKYKPLIDMLKGLYAELNQMNMQSGERKTPEAYAKDHAIATAEKNKAIEDGVLDAKKVKGDLKLLYRKIASKCHTDKNEKDEILLEALVAARTALEQKDLEAMQNIYQSVMNYKARTGAERRLTSLIKKNDDLKRAIQTLTKSYKAFKQSFDEVAATLSDQPEVLEPEFVNIVNNSITTARQRIEAIKAFKAQKAAAAAEAAKTVDVEATVVDDIDYHRRLDGGRNVL
jgi:hypothetical protein